MSGETARLRWRCRRGMREVELLLEAFLDGRGCEELGKRERAAFERLLGCSDQELLGYLYGRVTPSDREMAWIVSRIRTNLS